MLTLTAAITVPNITRMEVVDVRIRGEAAIAHVYVKVRGPAGMIYPNQGMVWELTFTGHSAQGIRAKASPVGAEDRVEQFSATVTNIYDNVVAQYRSGASDAAGRRNVETLLKDSSPALLPAGTVA